MTSQVVIMVLLLHVVNKMKLCLLGCHSGGVSCGCRGILLYVVQMVSLLYIYYILDHQKPATSWIFQQGFISSIRHSNCDSIVGL